MTSNLEGESRDVQ